MGATRMPNAQYVYRGHDAQRLALPRLQRFDRTFLTGATVGDPHIFLCHVLVGAGRAVFHG